MPITPYVKNRRLFIYTQVPFGNGLRKLIMSDDWDSEIPRECDRNFSSNAFEIINEAGRPVLQVFYRRSNEIEVSGIFVINTNDTLAAFGSTIVVFYHQTNGLYNAYIETLNLSTNWENFIISAADPYATTLSLQTCIFKYPSWKYPGVLNE